MTEIIKYESKDGNIYEVDGKRYHELTKEPAVGDTVLIVNAWGGGDDYEEGEVHSLVVIKNLDPSDVCAVMFVDREGGDNYLRLDEFVIVKPIEETTEQVDELEESEIAKLVREDIIFLDEKVNELAGAKPLPNITINIANINVIDIESAKLIVESFTKGRE
ncbi:hypothetical protein WAZ07_11855 [Bacillus sp. FJAT-51639]|uniref:Phage protein n=1 Tax=Bacillus bruguierae TaxID=3127667 RepID=A0ABU8FJA2_9BACI